MSAIQDTIASNERDTPAETADAVADALGVPAKWATIYRPVLIEACRLHLRNRARSVEHGGAHHIDRRPAMDLPTTTRGSPGVGITRAEFLAEGFSTP